MNILIYIYIHILYIHISIFHSSIDAYMRKNAYICMYIYITYEYTVYIYIFIYYTYILVSSILPLMRTCGKMLIFVCIYICLCIDGWIDR